MSLVVYQLVHSPYCIPITRALDALSVSFETREVPNHDRSEIITLTHGACYQVPLLVHNATPIYETSGDSLEIARYVDRIFAQGRLFPEKYEGLQSILVPHIEGEIEGTTFKLVDPSYVREIEDLVARTMTLRHKERKFGLGCVKKWAAERPQLLADAERLLAPYDLMLGQNPFLLTDQPVYADFALFGVLGNLTYQNYNTIPEPLDALTKWFQRMKTFEFAA
ncbi:hypothetical protein BH09VER1_BH09VER1_15320 [soil metagenome]